MILQKSQDYYEVRLIMVNKGWGGQVLKSQLLALC